MMRWWGWIGVIPLVVMVALVCVGWFLAFFDDVDRPIAIWMLVICISFLLVGSALP